MGKFIIEGSKKWIKAVPDEYAIKCVESYISPVEKEYEIFKFHYVQTCCGLMGEGFIQKCALAKLPFNIAEFIEGIIICENDILRTPSIYYKNKENITYAGILTNCDIFDVVYPKPKFSEIIHYSEKNIQRQKSDANAPEWLKEFAREHNANVAYFEF